MEYWRKNLSYKTKVFFFTYPPGCRWHCHGEAMWKSCEMREKCEILDGRELVHMHTSIQGQKDGRFFFPFSPPMSQKHDITCFFSNKVLGYNATLYA